jgi:hypothetical protein
MFSNFSVPVMIKNSHIDYLHSAISAEDSAIIKDDSAIFEQYSYLSNFLYLKLPLNSSSQQFLTISIYNAITHLLSNSLSLLIAV